MAHALSPVVLARVAADLDCIEHICAQNSDPTYDDPEVLAVQRLWIDVGFAFKEQLGLNSSRKHSPALRKVIGLRNYLCHTAIDDINVGRLWFDSRSMSTQLRAAVDVMIERETG